MATLTQEQINRLKQQGLSDTAINSLSAKYGIEQKVNTPMTTITPSQLFTLKQQGLSDTAIQNLSEKYNVGLPVQPEKQGLLKSIITEPIKSLVVRPLVRTAQVAELGAKKLFGSDESYNKALERIQTQNVNVPFIGAIEPQKQIGQGGARQIIGEAANTASFLAGGGGTVQAGRTLFKSAIKQGAKQGAKVGATGAGLYSFGESIQRPTSTVESVIGETLLGTTLGGLTGGVVGGTIPAISKGVQRLTATAEQKAVNQIIRRENQLTRVVDNNSVLRKVRDSAKRNGYDPIKDLAESDILVGAVNNDGRIDGKLLNDRFAETISGTENLIKNFFDKTGEKTPVNRFIKELNKVVLDERIPAKSAKSAQKAIVDILDGIEAKGLIDKDGYIKLADIQQLKTDAYKLSNFLDPEKTLVDKTIGRYIKEYINKNTKSVPELEALNKELGRFLSVKELIDKLDAKVVKGGRLGKYFSQAVGAVAGGQVGGAGGAIVGAEIGQKVQGEMLKRTFGKATGKTIQRSQKVEQAIQKSRQNPTIQLGQSNQVLARQIPQANNATAKMNVISKSIPTSSRGVNIVDDALNTVSKAVQTAKQALTDPTNASFIEANGGFKAVLEATKNNIADSLNAEGKTDIAFKILRQDIADIQSLDELYTRLGTIVRTSFK